MRVCSSSVPNLPVSQPLFNKPTSPKKHNKINIVVGGASGSGKTSFIKKLLHKSFSNFYEPTIGIEYHKLKRSSLEDISLDITGGERFMEIGRTYYLKAAVAILLYDVSAEEEWQMQYLKSEYDKCRGYIRQRQCLKILVGNKCDLQRKVSQQKIDRFAEEEGFQNFELSSKQNGFQSTDRLLQDIMRHYQGKQADEVLPQQLLSASQPNRLNRLNPSDASCRIF